MIENYLKELDFYKKIIDNDNVHIKNSNTDFIISAVVSDFVKNNKNIFLILPNLYEAQKTYDKLTNILNEEYVLFFPGDELIAAELLNVSGDFKYERINTIVSLLSLDRKYIVVMNVNSAIKYELNKDKWINSILNLKVGLDIDPNKLTDYLLSIGYTKQYTVTKTGEFSRRGEIIDIFPLNHQNPIRIDFFDTEIDSIKEFDIDTQKSLSEIKGCKIIPVKELFYNDLELTEALNKIDSFKRENNYSFEEENKLNSDILNFNLRQNTDNLLRYVSFFDSNRETILDYVSDKRVYLVDIGQINETYDHMINDLSEYCQSINGYSLLKLDYFIKKEKLISYANVISEGVSDYFKEGLNPLLSTIDDYKGIPDLIIKDFKEFIKNRICIITIESEIRLDRIKDIFLQSSIPYKTISNITQIKENQVNILYGQYFFTLSLLNKEINIINEKTLFENKYEIRRPKYKSVYKNTTKISHYNELKENDYVVHFDYGIGIYKGLKTMNNNGMLRDYLQISYADGDSLYVPVEQIQRIEKYNAGAVDDVKITKLRSHQWENAKERVRKKVHDISDKLVKLYAERRQAVGYKFWPDTSEQMEFENEFYFDLTRDQERAINDVKRDMESEKVMDRLICGDVGYGKTEVALRAAFKAVMNGKQVALLAPTTILSHQHYVNFKNRMEKYGVEIELINRFVPLKKQKEIFERIESGKTDIVIGTHRILSNDLKYKDLGLLIIDEEQRFGVLHKEKIRQIKVNVDTITLSATPIPRTLQMSIAGIKDLSMIETPPKNRYPIQTYVLERNDAIIRDAILRELSRGGQVFYMYNLVEDIEMIASKIQKLVPDAKIAIGHGKMEKNDLEDVITSFINHDYDILVCTTIIETGIDIPDCNTLIIHDSTKLGLSQLYQLRGRVGRSDRIAYAYMMYEPHKVLTEQSKKRLEAIKEFNELGSGYKIAMRDLAIRGAGDILGDEQSGFITTVGLETFLAILNEEMDKIKNKDNPKPVVNKEDEASVNEVLVSRTIDNNYISNDDVKIEIHKKIDRLVSVDKLEDLSEELHDRFGDFDDSLYLYMYEKLYNNLLKKMGIERIINNDTEITLFMSKEASNNSDGNELFQAAISTNKNIKLHYYQQRISINLDKKIIKKDEYIVILANFMDKIINKI